MSDILAALTAIQGKIQLADPSPSPTPLDANVWIFPADQADINNTVFPFVIISQFTFDVDRLTQPSMGSGSYRHSWRAQIDVHLDPGINQDIVQQAIAENLHLYWYKAVGDVLYSDRTLGETVDEIGPEFEMVTGNIPYFKAFTSWGIRFVIPVITTVCPV